jgi:uncharacterized protein (TIGR00251 family)
LVKSPVGEAILSRDISKGLLKAWQDRALDLKIYKDSLNELIIELNVIAKPGSKKERCFISGRQVQLAIAAKAIDGGANKGLLIFFAKRLGLSSSALEITSGEKSKQKRIAIHYSFSHHKGEDYYIDKLKKVFD